MGPCRCWKPNTARSPYLKRPRKQQVYVLVASKTKDIHTGNLVKELAPIVDGRGGGKPDMAMAGGSNQAKIQELLEAVEGKL